MLAGLAVPIADPRRMIDVLTHLARRAEEGKAEPPPPKPDSSSTHTSFRPKTHADWGEIILPGLRLPTRGGTWRHAGDLCVRTPGVDPSHVLDAACADLLRGRIDDDREQVEGDAEATWSDPDPSRAAAELRAYFDALDAPQAAAGGLLALLGDDQDLLELAAERLSPRTVAGTRAAVPWRVMSGSNTSGADKRLDELAASVRVAVTVSEPAMVLAINLLGDPVELPVAKRPESLLIGKPEKFRPTSGPHAGRPCWHLPLRRPPANVLSPAEAAEALRRTATDVINHVYWRWSVDLTDLWKELAESDQLDVEVAADMVLDQVDAHLRRLSTDRLPTFRPRLGDIDAARERQVEARRTKRHPTGQSLVCAVDAVRALLRDNAARAGGGARRAAGQGAGERLRRRVDPAGVVPERRRRGRGVGRDARRLGP